MDPDPSIPQDSTTPITPEVPLTEGENLNTDIAPTTELGSAAVPTDVYTPQTIIVPEQTSTVSQEIPVPVPQAVARSSGSHLVGLVSGAVVIVLLLLVGGGLVYAYIEKVWIFAPPVYTEDVFLGSLLTKAASIESVHYVSTGKLAVVDRDEDAKPFTIEVTNEDELRMQYQADAERATQISKLLNTLRYYYGTSTPRYDIPSLRDESGSSIKNPPYPATLEQFLVEENKRGSKSKRNFVYNIKDPITGQTYNYQVTKGGSDFELSGTFTLPQSVQSIRKGYGFSATSTRIDGQTVTFTKGSYGIYLSSTPPKPWLVTLSDMLRQIPPAVAVSFSMSAQIQVAADTPTDWTFNADASGDFGDLIYKVNADALKAGDTYYFRVNNMPSIFISQYAALKGVWVSISPTAASTTNPEGASYYEKNAFSYVSDSFKEWEEEVRKNRKEMTDMTMELARLADEMHLFTFIQKPTRDTFAGAKTYRYDLGVRKEAIVPYVKAVLELASVKKRSEPWRSAFVDDQGLLEYLESDEFEQIFDYLSKNIKYSIWVNDDGYAVGARYTLRVVPPDTALQLKDKQIEIVFDAEISKINEPFTVSVPKDAKPIEELFEELNANLSDARTKGRQASQKASISMIRASAEVVYDKLNGYGKNPFPVGPCAQTPNTLFAEADIVRDLSSATKGNIADATCASVKNGSTVSAFAVSVPLDSDPGFSWCVDSSGRSIQIRGAITEAKCELKSIDSKITDDEG